MKCPICNKKLEEKDTRHKNTIYYCNKHGGFTEILLYALAKEKEDEYKDSDRMSGGII